jgi:predicted PilT family ATPase
MEYNDIKRKEIYTKEEKQTIMEMLNKERKAKEKQAEKKYSEEEKRKILTSLNQERKNIEISEDVKVRRVANKKIYTINNTQYYKLENLERGYLMRVDDYPKLTNRPKIITLYYDFLGELKKKDFLIQIRSYSDKIFVSNDLLKVYFKACSFENN